MRSFLRNPAFLSLVAAVVATLGSAPARAASTPLAPPAEGEHIALIGNALAERMQYYGYFETLLHQRFPDKKLTVRNLGHSGDTPAYRPRAGRPDPWAFPGAQEFRPEFAMHWGVGHLPSPDEWLQTAKADTVIAFFGFNESFDGPAGVERFAAEVAAFVDHTRTQSYNGRSAPQLVLVSPIAFEDLSATRDLPDGKKENAHLALYTEAIRRVAAAKNVPFIDLFTPSQAWYAADAMPLTINGAHLNEAGDRRIGAELLDRLYGSGVAVSRSDPERLRALIYEKNWFWLNDYRMLNGVHSHGRRYKPFGDFNYPQEIEKIREMTVLRDAQVWAQASRGESQGVVDDSVTRKLDPVTTNYNRPITYLSGEDAKSLMTLPEGYRINLFAAETEFPELKDPVQMTFDNKGRLWVAVMPSYPHYKPGDPMPDDKIIILEDTDHDGRADKQTVFASGLHLPIGFELTPEGVYVTQQPNLILLQDLDGDDRADRQEVIMHGFDSHDTHHAISAFTSDPRGALYLLEGRFLHSQVETPYGCIRANDGGVFRFDPKSWRLVRYSQYDYNNPWGISFDDWGQDFISDASSGNNFWMLPLSLQLPFGIEYPEETMFTEHRVRPTSGTEFVSSRHFPDEVQGDFLVNNSIGFLGTKQHQMRDDGSGFRGDYRFDLLKSSDPNFRPVDLEFAPDGSLLILDWHNALIGHMQHSARDPNRDHERGRIYRITYPARPLVARAEVDGAALTTLLDNLKLPEYRSRYRTQRELRGRPTAEVLPAVKAWVARLDPADPNHERHLLEALWVTWAHERIDAELLVRCLTGNAPQLRAAAARVVRHEFRKLPNHAALLRRAAADPHPRVRLEAVVAASWVGGEDGASVVLEALRHPVDSWMKNAVLYTMVPLQEQARGLAQAGRFTLAEIPAAQKLLAEKLEFGKLGAEDPHAIPKGIFNRLGETGSKLWATGREVYSRDGHCATCHQAKGEGVEGIYPPLAKSEWVTGDPERLVKIILHGLTGEITVNGKVYTAELTPPMPGFGGMLSDEEIAGVATYVRQSFTHNASVITPATVKGIREATAAQATYYRAADLQTPAPPAKAP